LTTTRAAVGQDFLRGALDARQRRADFRRIGSRRRRENQALAHTLEQLEAEHGLEPGQLAADRALGQRQLLRSTGDAEIARTGLEGLKQGGGRGVPTHRPDPSSSFHIIMNA
jgi:hypothetical protein